MNYRHYGSSNTAYGKGLENIGYCYKVYEYCIDEKGTLIPKVIDEGQLTPYLICSPASYYDYDEHLHLECYPTCKSK